MQRRIKTERPRKPREEKPSIVVVEGRETETSYVDFVAERLNSSHVLLKAYWPKATDRRSLLKAAKALKQDLGVSQHSIWIMCDVDDAQEVLKSICGPDRRNGNIRWAISNPSIDAWLLMHLQSVSRSEHRDSFASQAKELGVVKGKRGKEIVFSVLEGHLCDALNNAQKLRKKHKADGTAFTDDNPSSDVDLMLWEIVDTHNKMCDKDSPERVNLSKLY